MSDTQHIVRIFCDSCGAPIGTATLDQSERNTQAFCFCKALEGLTDSPTGLWLMFFGVARRPLRRDSSNPESTGFCEDCSFGFSLAYVAFVILYVLPEST